MEHRTKITPENNNDKRTQEIRSTLMAAGIEPDCWGVGSAKTLNHLVQEVESGECLLEIDQQTGGLVRRVEVLDADVLYRQSDGEWLALVEDKQVFADGRVRQRNLEFSLAEKLTADEEVDVATSRAVSEELGVDDGLDGHYDVGTERTILESPSYPGLMTKYIIHKRVVTISGSAFNPDGYSEKQSDKTTYFVWRNAKVPGINLVSQTDGDTII